MWLRRYLLACWLVVLTAGSVLGVAEQGGFRATPSAFAAPDNSIVLQAFTEGLNVPIFVGNAGDGSGRLFVIEQAGKIKVLGSNGVPRQFPFLDLTEIVNAIGEGGLLSLAFHPNYETNGRFFVYYTAKPPVPQTSPPNVGSNTLAEYHVSNDPNIADPTPVRILFAARMSSETTMVAR